MLTAKEARKIRDDFLMEEAQRKSEEEASAQKLAKEFVPNEVLPQIEARAKYGHKNLEFHSEKMTRQARQILLDLGYKIIEKSLHRFDISW